jgi:uncharacterized protein YbjQ (UPF0145 family)
MIVTTTSNIEGSEIKEYLGVVSSQAFIGSNFFKDILAGLRDMFISRRSTYEKILEDAKHHAMQELIFKARSKGANAIVGVQLAYETVGNNNSMLMVSITGTAVRISA